MMHTPGPWKIDIGHQTKTARGISAERRNIVNFNGLSAPMSEETQFNALLIAAAPDLLSALQNTVALLDQFYARSAIDKVEYADAVMAIRKAMGEQS
jgi:hypothetical protein